MVNELFNIMRGNGDFFGLVIHLCVFLVLPFHEWAHAWVASLLGDKAIKYRGRLSLNPLSHIDYMGALCLLLFGFGWAKPVPVDPRNFKNPKWGMAIVSIAGPLANIVAAMAGGFIFYGVAYLAPVFANETLVGEYLTLFLAYYIAINCSLAVFNLLPIPPLDGSKILFAFLPDKWVYKIYQYQRVFSIILIALLFVGLLDIPLTFLQGLIMEFINTVCALPFKLIVG